MMKKYEDETIAALKKEMRREKYANITGEGVYIDNQFVKFFPYNISESISMYIPENFIEMPEEIQKVKYLSENRPEIILTSLDTTVNFAFNIVEEGMSQDQLESLFEQMKEVIGRVNPSFIFYQQECAEISEDQSIYMFDFKSHGIDEPMYNMMCYTSLDNKTIHGIFSCMERTSEEWKEAAWQAFKTISHTDKKELS